MALLDVLHFPDPRLRIKAKPVEQVDESIATLAQNMLETMYANQGIGLAATQVDVHLRVLVLDVSEERNQPLCLINPEIIATDSTTSSQEGCLSVPGYYDDVERAEKITVTALNEHGEAITLDADGLKAICIQHEMDHLQGKLFVDYLSPLKRQRLKKKLEKHKKQDIA